MQNIFLVEAELLAKQQSVEQQIQQQAVGGRERRERQTRGKLPCKTFPSLAVEVTEVTVVLELTTTGAAAAPPIVIVV